MEILVVSGFLGAGKTTFIKELIKRTGQDIVILENEYGDTDIDKNTLAATGDISVLDFVEGCVCCTMKEGFANSVVTIASTLDPDYLVIEPTGAAMLSEIKSNLRKVEFLKTKLLPAVTLVSPQNINTNSAMFNEIYTDQIRAADTVVFTKGESLSSEELLSAKEKIKTINPDAKIITDHYTKLDDSWWLNLLGAKKTDEKRVKKNYDISAIQEQLNNKNSEKEERVNLNLVEKEKVLYDGNKDLDVELRECSFKNPDLKNPVEVVSLLEDIARGYYGGIVRVKGVIKAEAGDIKFDFADGLYCITGTEGYRGEPQCVFIGRNIDEDGLICRLSRRGRSSLDKIKI